MPLICSSSFDARVCPFYTEHIYRYTWAHIHVLIGVHLVLHLHHCTPFYYTRQYLPCLFPPFVIWNAFMGYWSKQWNFGTRSWRWRFVSGTSLRSESPSTANTTSSAAAATTDLEWNGIAVHGPSLKDETQRSWRRAEWTDQIASKKYGSEFTALINPASVFLRCRVFNCFHIWPDEQCVRKRKDITLQNIRTIQYMHDAYLYD